MRARFQTGFNFRKMKKLRLKPSAPALLLLVQFTVICSLANGATAPASSPAKSKPSNSTRAPDTVQHEGSEERIKRQLYREQIPHHRPLSGNLYAEHHGFPHPGRWYSNAQQIVPPNPNSGHHFESPNVIHTDEDFNRYGSTLRHLDDHRVLHNPGPVVHQYPVEVGPIIPLGGSQEVHHHQYHGGHGGQGHGQGHGGQNYRPPAPVPEPIHHYGHVEHGHSVVHEPPIQHYHHHPQPSPHIVTHVKPKPVRQKYAHPYNFGGQGHGGQKGGYRPRFTVPFLKNLWQGRFRGSASSSSEAHRGSYSWAVDY